MQAGKLADSLVTRGVSAPEDRDILAYGLSLALELGVNITTTIALGALFGSVIESLVFLGTLSFLRSYAGGFHCKTARSCYLSSSVVVIGVLVTVKWVPVSYIPWMIVGLLLLSLPTLMYLAPIGTPTKPLDEVEHTYYRKKTRSHLLILIAVLPVLYFGGAQKYAFVVSLGIGTSAGAVLIGRCVSKRNL